MTSINLTASISEQINNTDSAEIRQIANFAWQHLKAATTFRNHAVNIEQSAIGQDLDSHFENIRSYTSAAVLSSVASLEALINELFIAPNCQLRPKISDFELEFWGQKGIERKTILEKYDLALSMIGKAKLDHNSSSYMNAWTLIELRNALVHYKPTWDPDRKTKVNLVQCLKGKYTLSTFVDKRADFLTMQSMSAGCASWAVDTVFAFLREFDTCSNLDPDKMVGFWQLET
jgi:hypothetical protein